MIIVGDFNSHVHDWCHDGQTDPGGRQLENLIRNYGLTINNNQKEFTCVRKNREDATTSLIDWTLTSRNVEVSQHITMYEADIFSDHVPVMIKVNIEYQVQ